MMSPILTFSDYKNRDNDRRDDFGQYAARACVLIMRTGQTNLKRKVIQVFGENKWQRPKAALSSELGTFRKAVEPYYKQ